MATLDCPEAETALFYNDCIHKDSTIHNAVQCSLRMPLSTKRQRRMPHVRYHQLIYGPIAKYNAYLHSARGRSAMHIPFVISSINIWPGAEASCISTFVRGRSTMHIPFGISSINIWPEAAEKRCAATRANSQTLIRLSIVCICVRIAGRQPHKTKACNAAGVGRGKCKAPAL